MDLDVHNLITIRRLVRLYVGVFILIALVLGGLHIFHADVKEEGVRWFNLDKERNLPTWFSGTTFFMFGSCACVAYYWERKRRSSGEACFRLPFLWMVVAAVGWLMSLDEMTILHENLFWKEIRQTTEGFGPGWKFLTQWQVFFALPVLLVVVFFVIFFLNRYSASRGALASALSGVSCWVGAFLLEAVRSWLRFTGDAWYSAGMIVEEELEILGAVLLLASIALYTLDIALDFSKQRRERLRRGARLLTGRVLVGVVLTFAVFGAGAGVAYALACKLADEDAPIPPLHRRALAAREAQQAAADSPVAAPADAPQLSRAVLDSSFQVGTRFLLANQTADGNFNYMYNFRAKKFVDDDNPVRQAGALWGLALIHQDSPNPETGAAVRRGLRFFDKHSVELPDGRKFPVYPGFSEGKTGTAALVTLAQIELLRSETDAGRRSEHSRNLDKLISGLLALRIGNGRFHGMYSHETGRGFGRPSPYSDGEVLLALSKASRYADRMDLKPLILESAEAMHQHYVIKARKKHPDSSTTKGYFQWSIMAYYEIHSLGWDPDNTFAARAIELGHWMIDTHHTLTRRKNTAYAQEGLITASELARRIGDDAAVTKFRRVVHIALSKLTSWQVGGPLQNGYLRSMNTQDPKAVGGVMNSQADPNLRIDVTQHQMHAVALARRFIYVSPSPGAP